MDNSELMLFGMWMIAGTGYGAALLLLFLAAVGSWFVWVEKAPLEEQKDEIFRIAMILCFAFGAAFITTLALKFVG